MIDAAQTAAVDGSANAMKVLLLDIVRALVDSPEGVSVEVVDSGKGTLLRLVVAPKDIGKVIGKQGRTARSLRTILGAASMKHQHRYSLDILQEGETATRMDHALTQA